MEFRWLTVLSLLPYFVLLADSAKITGCGTYVGGYNDPYMDCDALSTSVVNWTLVTESGVTRYLGSCHGVKNCSSPYSSSVLRLDLYYTHRIKFYNIRDEFNGNLTCQETRSGGTVDSDTCEINVVRVRMTDPDVQDGGSAYVYCYNSPSTTSPVTWTLDTDSGQTLDLGYCSAVDSCTSPHSPNITLTRPYNYDSYVQLRNVNRSLEGDLTCSFRYGGVRHTATKALNIYHRATAENCSVEISRHNWSAIFFCNITDVFSSQGLYDFRVYYSSSEVGDFTVRSSSGYIFDGRRSYGDGLTTYTKTGDNKVYNNGSLVYSWQLPDIPRRYWRFRVDVYYGYSISSPFYISQDISVARPYRVTHNCSEQNVIPETGVVPCVCTADDMGSPAGRLLWLLGDTVIATGDYGVRQLKFPSGKVSRQHEGMTVTCQLDWIRPISTQGIYLYNLDGDLFKWATIGLAVTLFFVITAFVVTTVILCRRGCPSAAAKDPKDEGSKGQVSEGSKGQVSEDDAHYYTGLNMAQVNLNRRLQQRVTCPSSVVQAYELNSYENCSAIKDQEDYM